MVKPTIITFLAALAMLWSLAAHAADTLADMDIIVDARLIADGIDPGEKHPVAGEVYHAEDNPQFIRAGIGPVVFIGDSIIHALNVDAIFPGAINLGVSGTYTATMLTHELPGIPANARLVIVEGGVNDFLPTSPTPPSQIPSNYVKILAGIPSGAKIKLIGILPINDAQLRADFQPVLDNARITATQAQIVPLCSGRCSVVPQPFGNSLPASDNIGDGVHLNVAGQAALAKALH